MKKLLLIASIVLFCGEKSYSQINIGKLLNASIKDANLLAQPYLKPYGEMLGVGLNSGWYNSAKPHRLLGFDLTVTGSYIKAPSNSTYFDLNNIQLNNLKLVGASPSIAPTVAGDLVERATLQLNDDPTNTPLFKMPNGAGMDYLPTPMVTAGIGLPMGIELKARFAPEVELGDPGKIGLWGIGIQKNIKDYIPGVKHVPVLNMSVLAGYTNFGGTFSVGSVSDLLENGSMDLAATAYTTRLLIGANLPVVAFYTGMGLSHSSSTFELLGDYLSSGANDENIKVSYTTNSFDMNVGMRIRLGVIAFHADYTLGEYSAITAGFGISFR